MQVLRDSSEVIEEYLTVMRREINPSKEYERLTRSVLSKIDVSTATQTDIIKFLDSLRKPEAADPMHKWIGSYNLYVAILKRFFKWYKTMREGEYEYIHEFKERINEIMSLQKKHHQIVDSPTEPTTVKQTSLAELHRLNITLSNYFDVAPDIINGSTLSETPKAKAVTSNIIV
jgi:hypothetical protein